MKDRHTPTRRVMKVAHGGKAKKAYQKYPMLRLETFEYYGRGISTACHEEFMYVRMHTIMAIRVRTHTDEMKGTANSISSQM